MPVLMALSVILSVCYAVQLKDVEEVARTLRWASAVSLVAALVSTIIFNVPINLATGKWDTDNPPGDWKESREPLGVFSGVAILASAHRLRALVPGDDLAFLASSGLS